jgi:hypothetical protein
VAVSPPTLETECLRLRRLVASDAEASHRIQSDHVISLIQPKPEASQGAARNLGMTIWKQMLFGCNQWLYDVWRVENDG